MFGLRRALALTTAERYVALIVSFGLMSILARLLTPAEIGVYVLANAVMSLFLAAREFATSTYLIQKKDLTQADQSTVFTLQFLLSVAIALILFVASPWLSRIVETPQVVPYLNVAALCILIEGCGGPISGLMRREMMYQKTAMTGIINAVVTAAATLGFALAGFGYMSFAGGWLLGSCATSITYIVQWNDPRLFRFTLASWREVLKFGSYNGATNILERIVEAVPYIFLGRILPIDALALYNRSLTICQLPDKVIFGGVFAVLVSAFSSHSRSGGDLKQVYLTSVENITALQWPALAVMAILAHPIVHVLLGNQWLASIPLIQIIAIASIFKFSNDLNYPLLIACGASRDVLVKSLIILPASAAILVVAALWGLNAAAWSAFVYLPFQAFVSTWFNRRHVEFTWTELFFAMRRAPILTFAACVGPLAVVSATGTFDLTIAAALVASILSGLGWLTGLWLLSHPLGGEISRIFRMVRQHILGEAATATVL